VTKQEAIAAIVACAEKLGHVPTIPELMKHERLDRTEIRRHFGNYKMALEQCQIEVPKWGQPVEMADVFRDWMGVARRLKRIPTLYEYEFTGKYRRRQLRRYFGEYGRVAAGMRLYAEEHGLVGEWDDVMAALAQPPRGRYSGSTMITAMRGVGGEGNGPVYYPTEPKAGSARTPVYGPVVRAHGFVFGPTNENGVVCLFGAMARDLGFLILKIQTAYPDCEAMRVLPCGRLTPVKIEFEYESRNFQTHMHDPAGCDLIVCWEHNWPDCPLEVVELRALIGRSGDRA
jgi:hypothetical protein